MIGKASDPPLIAFSAGVYKLFLAAYPKIFKQEYGPLMLQLFRDCCVQASREEGLIGMLRLWVFTLPDLALSLAREHMRKDINMSRSTFIKLSGWILILGGLASSYGLVAINMGLNSYYRLGLPMALRHYAWEILGVGFFCLAIGLFGLRARYGEEVGAIGRSALLIGGIAGIATVTLPILLGEIFAEDNWVVFWYATLVMYGGMLVFGGIALRRKPLPRWNGLPLIAGIWWPAYWIAYYITDGFFGYRSEPLVTSMIVVGSIMAASTVLMGFFLQAGTQEEKPATA